MSKQKNITIIGCGWLGSLVGDYLIKNDFLVRGSYRSESSLKRISETKIIPFELEIDINSQILIDLIENTDVLILALPPLNKLEVDYYGSVLSHIASQFSSETKIIFTSSIGVYPAKEGRFTEAYQFENNELNKSVLQAELVLKKQFNERLSILRLGGLIGPKRHPVYSLQGRTVSHDGNGPINLIHSSDICAAIQSIIVNNTYSTCYNLVFPTHPTKKMYYSAMAAKFNLEQMNFGTKESLNRFVDGGYIQYKLGFEYGFDPLDYTGN